MTVPTTVPANTVPTGTAPINTLPGNTTPNNAVPANAVPPTLPSNNAGNFNNNNVRQPTLGQLMPPIAANAPRIAALTRASGNSVTFKIAAKPGATVNVYRNGILVSSVPAAAAAALKVTDNPAGENSYQVVVVEQSGKISISEKSMVVTASTPSAETAGDSANNPPVAPDKTAANGNAVAPGKTAANGKAVAPGKTAANGKAAAPKKASPQSKASTSKNSK